MTAVKICGLTNLDDARWAWQCGADLLGFVFVRSSPRSVSQAEVARMVRALKDEACGARFVGVFADQSIEAVRRIARTCSLHLAQLHGGESPDYARALGVPVIVARRVRDRVPWDELSEYGAWAYLLDSYHPQQLGGTGHSWPWELLAKRPQDQTKIIIAGGLTPNNVALAIDQARPWGVDVSSGVEAHPGRKDPSKVELFVQRAKRHREATP